MSLATEMFSFSKAFLVASKAGGIPLSSFRAAFEYHIKVNKIQISISPAMYCHMLEIYLLCNNIEYSVDRARSITLLRGITFKNDNCRLLVDVLVNGLMDTAEASSKARNHYDAIK